MLNWLFGIPTTTSTPFATVSPAEQNWEELASSDHWMLTLFRRGKSEVREIVRINGELAESKGKSRRLFVETEIMKIKSPRGGIHRRRTLSQGASGCDRPLRNHRRFGSVRRPNISEIAPPP